MCKRWLLAALFACLFTSNLCCGGELKLEDGFYSPPPSARPWGYWFWLNGNITREGITADLEAMKRPISLL